MSLKEKAQEETELLDRKHKHMEGNNDSELERERERDMKKKRKKEQRNKSERERGGLLIHPTHLVHVGSLVLAHCPVSMYKKISSCPKW